VLVNFIGNFGYTGVKMSNQKRIVVTVLCGMLILSACTKENVSQMDASSSPSAAEGAQFTSTPTLPPATMTTSEGENSGNNFSTSLQDGKITIEVTSAQVYADPVYSQVFKFGLRFSGTLPANISDLNNFYPVNEVKFFLIDGEQETPFDLEQIGGGGGGPGILTDGTFSLDQDFAYQVVTPLSTQKTFLVKATVITNEALGISAPIYFEMNILPDSENRAG
jgi:hypothetical protein